MPPALPVTLHPSRIHTALRLLICLGFTALGVFMVRDGEWLGYPVGGLFALGISVFVVQFHPQAAFLRLDEAGFTVCSLFRAQTVRWETVADFGVITVHAFRMVAWNFVPGHPRTGRARMLSQAVSGYEAALSDTYGLKPVELANLMNTLRQRWGEPPAEPFFSPEEVERLIRCQPVREPLPFDPADDRSLKQFYGSLVGRIEREQGLCCRVEWSSYGSGYASFVEAWFYPADGRGRLSGRDEHHAGLMVLLSRLSPYFALGQDEKTWSATGGSGSLPNFSTLDDLRHPAVLAQVVPVTSLLTAAGLWRLHRPDLAALLPESCRVPTILSDAPFRQFDALFHWED